MKKAIKSIMAVWILVSAGLIGLLLIIPEEGMKVSAATITVDDSGGADYTTIQAAIDSATAGDTIIVKSGTYYENVVINKELTLNGDGMTSTTIDGGGNGDVIIITSNSVDISGFTITNGGNIGITLSSVSNCNIFNNTINSNDDDGIYLDDSDSNTITNNICISNGDDGIYLDGSDSNTITNNTSNLNSDDGIEVAGDTNTIVNNMCSNNEDGIKLEDSTNNLVRGNTVSSNSEIGVNLESSFSNKVYHNSIINNAIQAYDDGANVWSYQKEGNYWSDYNGKDGNDDHIGDAPYVIEGNIQDKYPLMEPYDPNLLKEAEEPSTMTWILFSVLAIIIICIIVLVFVLRKRAGSAEEISKVEEQAPPGLSYTGRSELEGQGITLAETPQETFQVTCSICNNLLQVNDIGVTMNVTCPFCSTLLTVESKKAATQPPPPPPQEPPTQTQPVQHSKQPGRVGESPLNILKKRLARGEIDLETYRELKKELE